MKCVVEGTEKLLTISQFRWVCILVCKCNHRVVRVNLCLSLWRKTIHGMF